MSHLETGTVTGRFAPADRVCQNCSEPDLALSRGRAPDGRGYRDPTAHTVEKEGGAEVASASLCSCTCQQERKVECRRG